MTPEQRAASNRLDTAIRECVETFADGEPWMVAEWVVIGSTVGGLDADGDEQIGYFTLYPGAVSPDHVTLGLMDVIGEKIRARHHPPPG